ncbi:MAG TPA: glycosyltransferase [Frankiaceae bacterium]|nr:glycosyltransferase [Frankiaceae bacterium]
MRPSDAAGIRWIGVVVPAHNEEELLPACLAGLAAAVATTPVPAKVLVVLDNCTDASSTAAADVSTLTVSERNVGAARRAGFGRLLRSRPSGVLDSQTWFATTDADTVVPSNWLTGMLKHAALGWDAIAGTVRVGDWDGHAAETRAVWRAGYDSRDGHRHVHGANLGFRADAYRAAGGVPPIALSEDEQLIAALEAAGRRVLRTGELPVVTSGRRRGRVDGGFASFLLRTSPAA